MQIERFAVDQTDLTDIDLAGHQRVYVKISNALLCVGRMGVDLRRYDDAKPALYKAERSDDVSAHQPRLWQEAGGFLDAP